MIKSVAKTNIWLFGFIKTLKTHANNLIWAKSYAMQNRSKHALSMGGYCYLRTIALLILIIQQCVLYTCYTLICHYKQMGLSILLACLFSKTYVCFHISDRDIYLHIELVFQKVICHHLVDDI
jgi:hypothetical protein